MINDEYLKLLVSSTDEERMEFYKKVLINESEKEKNKLNYMKEVKLSLIIIKELLESLNYNLIESIDIANSLENTVDTICKIVEEKMYEKFFYETKDFILNNKYLLDVARVVITCPNEGSKNIVFDENSNFPTYFVVENNCLNLIKDVNNNFKWMFLLLNNDLEFDEDIIEFWGNVKLYEGDHISVEYRLDSEEKRQISFHLFCGFKKDFVIYDIIRNKYFIRLLGLLTFKNTLIKDYINIPFEKIYGNDFRIV